MIGPIFSLALVCSSVTVVNYTKEWIKIDQLNYNQAVKRCPELYKDAPCLKTFIKKRDRVYNAICGKKTNKRK